jgi:hypothetical protein
MDVAAKLGYRGQTPVALLDVPAGLAPALAPLAAAAAAPDPARPAAFALAFVLDPEAVDRAAAALLPALAPDAPLWLAYPKTDSALRRSALSRDAGWAALGAAGFEGVRQIALDADWSALRFRHVDRIARLARDPARAISAAGRARAAGRPKPPLSP